MVNLHVKKELSPSLTPLPQSPLILHIGIYKAPKRNRKKNKKERIRLSLVILFFMLLQIEDTPNGLSLRGPDIH